MNWDNLIKIETRTNLFPIVSRKDRRSKELCICLLNTQSARNKIEIIRNSIIEHDIDMLAMTETWLTSAAKDELFIKGLKIGGYDLFSVPRKGNGGYGGVAILYKKNLSVLSKTSCEFSSFEHCEVTVNTGSKQLNVNVVYRPPPSQKNKLTNKMFFDEFSPFMHDRISSTGHFLLLGDLNFHLEDRNDTEALKMNDLFDTLNYKQHVTTRTHKSGHTLDVFITRDNENLISQWKVGDQLSDHNLILCDVSHPKPRPIQVPMSVRKLRSVNMPNFRDDLKDALQPGNAEGCSVEDLTNHYNSALTKVLDKHAPARVKMETIRPKQPWFSDDLYGAKREKRKWERKWRDTNLTVHYDLFKTARTKFNNMLLQAKKDYYNNLIAESSTDSKNLSNIVKEILHQRSEMKLPEHASTEELANRFAVFFTDKVCKIRKELPDLSRHQLNLPTPALTCSLNVFSAVTESEVRKIIAKSPTKSCSLDPAPTWMVKDSVDELIPMVTILVNLSLQSANVPDSMKQALVTLLLKKDDLDPEVLKNYRPVSNLSFLSKVLERVVAARLTNYMTINQLHEPMQSAYRACHSTETALVRVQNDILRTLDQGGAAILVLLDLSAAFDTIDHSILLSRMESVLGVKGSALQWFKSYLLGRKQRIKINDDFSENQEILWSVPQGSVLGALLFLIYIIPLAQLIRSYGLNNHGYADDTQLCLSFKKTSDNAIVKREILNLEKCLCDISVWMSQNKLKLNNDKTEIILFGSKKHLAELNIKSLSVAGTDVSVASEPVRNLGAMFDSQLIMAPHVKSVVKKSSFHLRNIGKARRVLTEDATKTVMQSLVMSRLDYCNVCGMAMSFRGITGPQQAPTARLFPLAGPCSHLSQLGSCRAVACAPRATKHCSKPTNRSPSTGPRHASCGGKHVDFRPRDTVDYTRGHLTGNQSA